MKKILLISSILLYSICSHSQPIYNAADYANIDSSFVLSRINAESLASANLTATGTGYSWNFSDLAIASQKSIDFINPDNSGYFESYILNCLAGGGGFTCYEQWENISNLSQPSDDTLTLGGLSFSNMVNFFNKENNLVQTMIGLTFSNEELSIPMPLEYEIPDTIYKFPLNYEDSIYSHSSYRMNLDITGYSIEYINHSYRTTIVEGYGDIATPYKGFPNSLKLKTIIQHEDTLIYNGTTIPLVQADDIIFTWLNPNFGHPVFQAEGSVIGASNYIFNKATFIDTIRCLEPTALFMSLPQTAYLDPYGEAEIAFFNLSQNADSYNWDFGDTQNNSSSLSSPTHIYTEAGIFNVKLVACNSICNPQLCDSMISQVEVIDTSSVYIDEISQNKINIYPNPAKKAISISSKALVGKKIWIEIYSLEGILIKREMKLINNISHSINLSSLKSGIYFINIKTNSTNKTFKISKL